MFHKIHHITCLKKLGFRRLNPLYNHWRVENVIVYLRVLVGSTEFYCMSSDAIYESGYKTDVSYGL